MDIFDFCFERKERSYYYDVLSYCLHLMDYLWENDALTPSTLAEVVASFGSAFVRDQSLKIGNKNPFVFLVDERMSLRMRDEQ